ncbi:hypothetical protein [Spirosoma luteum]|uniref:hypothetical protein n=1 Tax=Spirosoma luteum TaxID=431553 RepID=UPI00039B0567|nr:hypothetical protein [Spirosoma luteum]
MNKGERAQIADRKWKRRLSLYNVKPEQGISLKTTSRPCNCWACKKERYRRELIKREPID